MGKKLRKKDLDGFLEAAEVFYEECRELYEKDREEYFRKRLSSESSENLMKGFNRSIYILLDKKNDIISYIGIFNDFKSLLDAAEILENQKNAVIYEVEHLNYMRINPEGVDSMSTLSLSAADFCKRFKITATPNKTSIKDTYTNKRYENLLNYLWQYIMDQYDVISRGDDVAEVYKAYLVSTMEVLVELGASQDVSFYKAICETAIRLFENFEE